MTQLKKSCLSQHAAICEQRSNQLLMHCISTHARLCQKYATETRNLRRSKDPFDEQSLKVGSDRKNPIFGWEPQKSGWLSECHFFPPPLPSNFNFWFPPQRSSAAEREREREREAAGQMHVPFLPLISPPLSTTPVNATLLRSVGMPSNSIFFQKIISTTVVSAVCLCPKGLIPL